MLYPYRFLQEVAAMKNPDYFIFDSLSEVTASELNQCIIQSDSSSICLIDSRATNPDEVSNILNSYPILPQSGIIIMGKNISTESCADLIMLYPHEIYAVVISKKIFRSTGCFNEKLPSGVISEFLCRSLASCTSTVIPCDCDGCNTPPAAADSDAFAYILRESIPLLSAQNQLNMCYSHLYEYFDAHGLADNFVASLDKYTGKGSDFSAMQADTAPILIIIGDNTCYGTLRYFGRALAEALAERGQCVITSEEINNSDYYLNTCFKAVIGFQSPALFNTIFRQKSCPKLQFWFDHPGFFPEMFSNIPDDYFFLCQDFGHAEYIRGHYGIANALHLWPGGTPYPEYRGERPYDISFVGSYIKPSLPDMTPAQKHYYDYMLSHPMMSFEEGLSKSGVENLSPGITLSELRNMCLLVAGFYKHKVVKAILDAGLTLHVCGKSWYAYSEKIPPNLIIHDAIDYEEAHDFWAHSKISLNIMTWHKCGMTERIAQILLSDSVCVSDTTAYLSENFSEDELCLFSLDAINKLPRMLNELLDDPARMELMRKKGRKKALFYHTWAKKAEEICNLLVTNPFS